MQTVYYFSYDSDIKFAHDFEKLILLDGKIYSKRRKNEETILNRDDGTIIELINVTHPTITNMLDKKLFDSFVELFTKIKSEESYKFIYLTASVGRSGIELMTKTGTTNAASIICEIEIDEEKNVTSLGQQMLSFIMKAEFGDWLNIFLTGEEKNNFKVCYDDKVMIINNGIAHYVKPEARKMEEVYLTTLEKLKLGKR